MTKGFGLKSWTAKLQLVGELVGVLGFMNYMGAAIGLLVIIKALRTQP